MDTPALFLFSIDFELMWGTRDKLGCRGLGAEYAEERAHVIDRLLSLLVRYQIPATWAVVGHLMLDSCRPLEGVKHPELVAPTHAWLTEPWLACDPGTDEGAAPEVYARSLVERIQAAPVPMEIGSHSFTHVVFGDPGCSPDTARTELDAVVRTAQTLGVTPTSFVFPRNSVGHLDVLHDHGFKAYRGLEDSWWNAAWVPIPARRAIHVAAMLVARGPKPTHAKQVDGVVNLPASMFLMPLNGWRAAVPMGRRVLRARRGIDRTIREGGMFHLWLHPVNLVARGDVMFGGLEEIFQAVAARREAGALEAVTMAQAVERLRRGRGK